MAAPVTPSKPEPSWLVKFSDDYINAQPIVLASVVGTIAFRAFRAKGSGYQNTYNRIENATIDTVGGCLGALTALSIYDVIVYQDRYFTEAFERRSIELFLGKPTQ